MAATRGSSGAQLPAVCCMAPQPTSHFSSLVGWMSVWLVLRHFWQSAGPHCAALRLQPHRSRTTAVVSVPANPNAVCISHLATLHSALLCKLRLHAVAFPRSAPIKPLCDLLTVSGNLASPCTPASNNVSNGNYAMQPWRLCRVWSRPCRLISHILESFHQVLLSATPVVSAAAGCCAQLLAITACHSAQAYACSLLPPPAHN